MNWCGLWYIRLKQLNFWLSWIDRETEVMDFTHVGHWHWITSHTTYSHLGHKLNYSKNVKGKEILSYLYEHTFENLTYNFHSRLTFNNTVGSHGGRWCLKSPTTRLFVQQLVRENNRGNLKTPHLWSILR